MVSARHLGKQELLERVPATHSEHEGDSSTAVACRAYGYSFSAWKCHVDKTEDFGYFSISPTGVMSLPDVQKCWTKGCCLQINPLSSARAVSPAWPGCLSPRHSPTLQMACTDAVNQPHPDVPGAAHLGSACWETQPRSAPSPGAAHRQPPTRCWARQPSVPSFTLQGSREETGNLFLCLIFQQIFFKPLLLRKQESKQGATEGREHPCAQPSPHAASPQRVRQEHPSPHLLSPS